MNVTEETLAGQAAVHTRVRHGLRKPQNWVQLFKFVCVGGSGAAVNLAVFSFFVVVLDVHHLAAAVLAWIVAVMNNFWLNRHWTFGARDGHAGFQAARFFAVSLVALGFQLAALELLVGVLSVPKVLAQALSLASATPLNFVGNKMWSFGSRR